MALRQQVIKENNIVPNTGAEFVSYYVADTEADKPASGLVAGDLCFALDSKTMYVAISATEWVKMTNQMYASTSNVTLLGTTQTETTLIGSGVGSLTLPAGFFIAGKTLRLEIGGAFGINVTTPRYLRFRLKKGSTVLGDTEVLLPNDITNGWWSADCLVTGVSTTSVRVSNALLRYWGGADPEIKGEVWTDAASTVTINSTAEAIDFTGDWPADATADDMVRCSTFIMTAN